MDFELDKTVYCYEQNKFVRMGLIKYYDPLLYSDIYQKTIAELSFVNHVLPFSDGGSNLYPSGINAHSFEISLPYDDFDWYVDSISGSDAYDGRTMATPFKTIGKLNSVLTENQKIGLARGSEWREQIEIPETSGSFLIAAYGSGNKPIIRGDDICNNANFVKTGSLTNVYQISLSVPYSPAEPSRMLVFENDVSLQYRSNPSLVDSNPGSYYTSSSSTSAVLYVHASDSSNIITNGKKYEATTRWCAVYGPDYYNRGRVKLVGLDMRRAYNDGGIVKLATSSSMVNCNLRDGGKHLAYIGEGAYISNCAFTDCWYDLSATILVFNKDIPTNMDNRVENSYFQLSSPSQWGAGNVAPMNSHNNVSGSFGDCYVNNCTFKNFSAAGTLFALNHHKNIYITNFLFLDSYGISTSGSGNISGSFLFKSGSWINFNLTDIRGANFSTIQTRTRIEDVSFIDYQRSQSGVIFVGAKNNLEVINCRFDNHYSGANRFPFYLQNCSTGSFVFRGNDYRNSTTNWSYQYCFLGNAYGMNWDSDYNFFDATNDAWYIFGTVYSDLASYQSSSLVSPRDSHSVSE